MHKLNLRNCLFIGLITGLLIFSNSSAGQKSIPDFPPENVVLLFNSGFEPGSRIVHGNDPFTSDDNIAGKDLSVAPPNDWVEDFKRSPNLGAFSLQYQGADTTKRFARIIPEPGNPENHVLQFRINEPWVNSKGSNLARIQANIYERSDKKVEGIKELYQRVRLFLHEDMEVVSSYPNRIHWLTIMEVWNNLTWGTDPYPFRITVGMGKPSAENNGLFFMVDAEDYNYRTATTGGGYTKIWNEMNTQIKIPVGQWMTLEYYIVEGGPQDGRFYMAMTPEGGERSVVFDIRHFTHNTKDPDPQGITLWNPMKLYTSRNLVNFVKGEGKSLQIYFDDFEIWGNKGPTNLRPSINGVAKFTDNINGFAEASSTKPGTIYLVKYGLNADTQAELDSLVNANLGRKVNAFEAGIPVIIYTKGLPGGYYQYYAVDMENRVSLPSPGWVSIDQSGPVTGLDTPIFKQNFSAWQQNRQIIVDPGNDQSYSLTIYTITGQLFYQGKNLSGIQSVNLDGTRGILIIRKQSKTGISVVELVVN